ncbi:unnamed protein product [Macrosiphum euphorbiae]|uniref:Uncharacterized protein n=1 Tax=Macrosiphum euphorbiae TaxID=13131 RepID=A0AAV0VT19_9HEMI|nr:unnamed protein product [Macrosiphum euphorbiae]CAI6352030.1 unnamed protein product [Macrosiphum euphorbiae]CAI6376005.1 unnamed protein product [Macrosiphum euphorbiae]
MSLFQTNDRYLDLNLAIVIDVVNTCCQYATNWTKTGSDYGTGKSVHTRDDRRITVEQSKVQRLDAATATKTPNSIYRKSKINVNSRLTGIFRCAMINLLHSGIDAELNLVRRDQM